MEDISPQRHRDGKNVTEEKIRKKTVAGKLNASGLRFGIVVSRFNEFITDRLLRGAYDGLIRSGAEERDIKILRVPGSFEIPSAARTLAETKKYDAIICLGCLLRGDTAHYDVIVNEVTRHWAIGTGDWSATCFRRSHLRHARTGHRSRRTEDGQQGI